MVFEEKELNVKGYFQSIRVVNGVIAYCERSHR